ncbi:MAG: redoxin domain-containing protein [Gammaproteobacteria bacterium]|nr:redoxin domain-containing protein [Gammaproteobacteria bacterium]
MRLRRLLGDALIGAALVFGVNAYLARHVPATAPALPPAWLKTAPALGRGQVVLIDFWASWCPFCRADQGTIQAVARHYPTVIVATGSPAAAVARFARRHHWQTPVILDPSGVLARRYGANTLPTAVIVGAQGHIRAAVVGYATAAGLRMRLWWAQHIPSW